MVKLRSKSKTKQGTLTIWNGAFTSPTPPRDHTRMLDSDGGVHGDDGVPAPVPLRLSTLTAH